MKEFMSYLIIIAIIAFIGFICYMIVKRTNSGTGSVGGFQNPLVPGGSPENYPAQNPAQNPVQNPFANPVVNPYASAAQQEDDFDGEETGIFTEWAVIQFDPVTHKQVKRQNIKVPEKGKFTIGRNKACDFVLEGATAQDYASRMHLGVGKDENGYFAKPLPRKDNSLALTYIDGQQVVDSFDLADKQIVLLGKIPIAFVRNEELGRNFQLELASDERDDQSYEQDYEHTMAYSGKGRAQEADNGFTR